jgi:ribonuclease BN (tRNA processing enzyme)
MCGCFGELIRHAHSRRATLTAAAVGIPTPESAQSATTTTDNAEREAAETRKSLTAAAQGARTTLLFGGTAGGPSFWPNTDRAGISTALVVGDAAYMIDAGAGGARRITQGLEAMNTGPKPGNTQALKALKALFLTHMHSDHTVDLPALLLYGYFTGLDRPERGPLHIYGPGPRGELAPIFTPPGQTPKQTEPFAPANPTPGTSDMIALLLAAYATDINDRMRDNGKRPPERLVQAHDIALPPIEGFVSPNTTPSPDMAPFNIYEDDRVRVTATLGMHAPIFPSFAYRFDTEEGSVVFSGDTGPSNNIVRLAQGADVLVHEVIVTSYIDRAFPPGRDPATDGLRAHLLSAHTSVEQVGAIAERAGVKTLVLNHFVPGNATAAELLPAQQGFSGRLVIAEDLLTMKLR